MAAGYQNLISLSLIAAVANGISTSQSKGAAGNLTITGSLAAGGVATFDVARRVIVTSAADDSGITFTITGTDRYGRAQVEVLTGANTAAAQTSHDFLTVSQIRASAATAGNVTAGTSGVGSSAPVVLDAFVNPASYGCKVTVSGTVNYSVEFSLDDFSPAWDLNANTPVWDAAAGFSANSVAEVGTIQGPATMIRLTNNSGTGTSSMRLIQPLAGRSF